MCSVQGSIKHAPVLKINWKESHGTFGSLQQNNTSLIFSDPCLWPIRGAACAALTNRMPGISQNTSLSDFWISAYLAHRSIRACKADKLSQWELSLECHGPIKKEKKKFFPTPIQKFPVALFCFNTKAIKTNSLSTETGDEKIRLRVFWENSCTRLAIPDEIASNIVHIVKCSKVPTLSFEHYRYQGLQREDRGSNQVELFFSWFYLWISR